VAIIVDYVTRAFVVIIQLCVTPVSAVGLAARMQVITFCVHVLAALQIRALRACAISSRAAVPAYFAAQCAVVIDNAACTALEAGKTGLMPVTLRILAACNQCPTIHGNVITRLLIRSLRDSLRH
jgi:hypothetical protein